jgi:hypothetical protein
MLESVVMLNYQKNCKPVFRMDTCSFCHAINCVVNVHGEYTCKCCGTVFNVELQDPPPLLFDDNIIRNKSFVNCNLQKKLQKLNRMCEEYDGKKKVEASIIKLCGILEHKLMLDETFIETTKTWFNLLVSSDQLPANNLKKELYFVCCCYCVSMYLKRGLELKIFCGYFDIKLCQAWSYLPVVTNAFKGERWYNELVDCLESNCEKIKRTVYELSNIEPYQQADIIKRACKLYLQIQNYSKITACKQINVRHTCVYIVCQLTGVHIKKKCFVVNCACLHLRYRL